MKKIFGIFILIIFTFFATKTQTFAITDFTGVSDGTELSIEDCVQIGLSNDPNITKYENYIKVAKSLIGQTKSAYFPTLGLTTGYFVQTNSEPRDTTKYYGLNLNANQLIWDFGKTQAKLNMNKYNLQAAKYDLDNAVLERTYKVKSAYYDTLRSIAKRYIAERSVKINELHVERTKALYYEGLKSRIDLVNAEVYLTESKIALEDAISSFYISLVILNGEMYCKNPPMYGFKMPGGFEIRNDYLLSFKDAEKISTEANGDGELLTTGIKVINILEDYPYKMYEKPLKECLEDAENNNPSLLSLRLAEKASEESLKSVKRMYFPEITGTVGYTHRNTHVLINNGFSANASFDLGSVNIMNVKTKIDEAKALVEIAKCNRDIRSTDLHFKVRDAYGNLLRFVNLVPLRKEKVAQTLENFKLADGRYTVGTGNFIELQEAHNNYNEAQLEYVDTIFDYNMALLDLSYAMGDK